MRKKKKPQKKSAEISSTLSSEERTFLENLLADLPGFDPSTFKEQPPSPRVACALVESLPVRSPETPGILSAVSEIFRHKDVQKAVKKALFRLRQSGATVPETDSGDSAHPLFKKLEQPQASSFLGPIDGMGSRAVFISIPQVAQGVDLGMGIVNDEQGILEFLFGRYGRKQAREVQEVFFERVPHLVGTSLSHAAAVLEKAYGKKGADESARGYLKLRPWLLKQAPPLERPPVYALLSLEEPSASILTGSQIQKLLDHETMATWMIDLQDLKPVVEEIIQAEKSPILVSQGQRLERIREIREGSILKLYPDSKRALLKSRLEEMAYLFLKLGVETHARLALAAALSLDEKDSPLRVNPFLKAILERSLNKVLQIGRETEGPTEAGRDSSSRIIVP